MTATSGFYTDLNDAQWAIVAPLLPAAKPGSRLRTTCMRGVLDGVSYLLRTGCQWRLLSRCFPPWSTVHHYFRVWQHPGFWVRLHRAVFSQARLTAGRPACPSLVIMDGQSVRRRNVAARAGSTDTSWFGAQAAHFGHTLGLLIASRVEPANVPDQKAGPRLLAGLRILFPGIRTVMADPGHESSKLTRHLRRHEGWTLIITRGGQRAFKIKGLTSIVERSFAWLGRSRRFSKDNEFKVQTSEPMIDIAAIRLMLNRIAREYGFSHTLLRPGRRLREVMSRHPEASVIIPPRSSAVPSDTARTAPTMRDRHLQIIAERGRMTWQKVAGYNWRALTSAVSNGSTVMGCYRAPINVARPRSRLP